MNTYVVIREGRVVQIITAHLAQGARDQVVAHGDLFLRVGGGPMSDLAMPRLGVPDFPPESKP